MLVADTSAVVAALTRKGTSLAEPVLQAHELHAPHLIDVEFLQALRKLVLHGRLSDERAAYAREDFVALRIRRYPHELLADRIWELRDTLTAYDATFVALAEALDLPMVTCDARLAAASGHHAAIDLHGQP